MYYLNIPLYILSFEYDNQEDLLTKLLDATSDYTGNLLLGENDRVTLSKYRKLCHDLKDKPSLELLKKSFPTLSFDNMVPLKRKQLEEQITLDLNKLNDVTTSAALMNISSKISQDGLTAEVLDQVLKLSKVSTGDFSYNDLSTSIKDIYLQSAIEKGIKTGVEQIDEITGGLQPGTFNCLAGFAGAGKTTAAVNIAYNALEEGKNVCYITLEVPKVDMYYNFYSRHSFSKKFKKPISHSDIKKKLLSKEDTEYLFNEVAPDFHKMDADVYILDEQEFENYDFQSFERKIRECDNLAQEKTGKGIELLIIDQAQLLKFGGGIAKAGNETSIINLYVSFFRQQAINFLHDKRTCTVLMLSQINRDGYSYACKHNGMYSLTNLAEANELERASAMVIALYSDESLKASKQINVQLLKSRNGQTLVDPSATFMDPVYYVFGSQLQTAGTTFMGSMDSLFSSSNETYDFNGTNDVPVESSGNMDISNLGI